jgi:putative colanic acid biosynthesis acetyltransferase WcaF
MIKDNLTSSSFSVRNKFERILWNVIYILFFRFTPVPMFKWRSFILRLLGSNVHFSARVYPTVNIWLPSNLIMGELSTLAPFVNIYNQGTITVGNRCIISQNSHICASTHDYNSEIHPLLLKPIVIGNDVWICAGAFIGPGVSIADGTVIGARAVMTKNSDPWSVYAGNPCRKVNVRKNFRE